MTHGLDSRPFGMTPEGEAVEAWTLRGSGGLAVEVLTYGATICRIEARDREGRAADVVLGFDDITQYWNHSAYFGGVIGRVAGRISNAQFVVDGALYRLLPNDSPNHLHGGKRGFDRRLWSATPNDRSEPSLRLTYRSLHMEEGYPGNVTAVVAYTVTNDNALVVETSATTDQATPFNLTLHPYFNLAGEASGPIADQELMIAADDFIPADDTMRLLGVKSPVIVGKNDLRRRQPLGDIIPRLHRRHGDLYVMRRTGGLSEERALVTAAELWDPGSGRLLKVSTTEAYLQLYTSVGLDGTLRGRSGVAYPAFSGICLECEGYPDGANCPELGDIVLRPGRIRREVTKYAFSCH